MPDKQWKVIDLLNTTADYLKNKNIENARLNAERLLGHVLGLSRVQLYVHFERPLTEPELDNYRRLIARRAKHEPLQYILGETEFMGLPFQVNPHVLIPRPETEVLCEEVLKLRSAYNGKAPRLLDIGTGSGCIPVSLAHHWPGSVFYAIDCSEGALETADKNARQNRLSDETGHFIRKDLFSNWPDERLPAQYDIVVSNPPYIAAAEMNSLQPEVAEFEPREALTDGGDGLRFYKKIFELFSGGALQTEHLFLEMSGSQPQQIIRLAREHYNLKPSAINDLNDIPRVLSIHFK